MYSNTLFSDLEIKSNKERIGSIMATETTETIETTDGKYTYQTRLGRAIGEMDWYEKEILKAKKKSPKPKWGGHKYWYQHAPANCEDINKSHTDHGWACCWKQAWIYWHTSQGMAINDVPETKGWDHPDVLEMLEVNDKREDTA